MRDISVLPGSLAIAALACGCALPVVEHDLTTAASSGGPPALLEYKETERALARVHLVEVDGHQVETGQAERRPYRFDLTMTGLAEEAQSGVPVRGPFRSLTLNAEAGHTYRINPNIETVSTQFDKDGIGRTRMTNALRWNPVIEDVTGKALVDE